MQRLENDGLEDLGWAVAMMLALIFLTIACAGFIVWWEGMV